MEDRTLLSAGTLDTSFDSDGKATTDFATRGEGVTAVARQADGKIVTVGYSMHTGNVTFSYIAIARFASDGSLDATFAGGAGKRLETSLGRFRPSDVAVQADGKILVTGANGSDFTLVRFNADGSLDTSFGTGGKATADLTGRQDEAVAVRILGDGKILLAGRADNPTNVDFAVARLNADGSLDTAFGTGGLTVIDFAGGHDWIRDLEVTADGKIFLAGSAVVTGDTDFALVRLNADGSLDSTFDGDGKLTTDFFGYDDEIKGIALQEDGKVIAAGWTHTSLTGVGDAIALARYDLNGALDASFDGDGKKSAYFGSAGGRGHDVAIDAGGRILVAADQFAGTDNQDWVLFRLNADGGLDASFAAGGRAATDFAGFIEQPARLLIDPDGKILVVGEAIMNSSSTRMDFGLARFHGTLYPTITASSTAVSTNEGSAATLTGTYTNAAGGTVTFVASVGTVTDNGNGTWTWSYTPADNAGAANVSLTITNSESSSDSLTFALTVNNVAPAVAISGAPSVVEGSTYTLSLAAPDPGADTITGWTIHWGDGTTSNVVGNPNSVTHVYDDNGTYVVTATATDEDGTWAATSGVTVGVSDSLPHVIAFGAFPGSVNEGGSFTLSGTFLDLGLFDTHTVFVNWGDGTTSTVSASRSLLVFAFGATHVYADDPAGTSNAYTVTVSITDDDGGVGVGATSVTVNNLAPTAVSLAGAANGTPGRTVAVLGSATDNAGANDTLTYTWNVYKDGAATSSFSGSGIDFKRFEFRPTAAGAYRVDLVVSDEDGGTSAATSHTVHVTPFDLIGYRDGVWTVSHSTGSGFDSAVTTAYSIGTAKPQYADADGDGDTDVFALVNGQWHVGIVSSASIAWSQPATATWSSSAAWDDVKVGDLNGDGRADILGRSGGHWWGALSTSAAVTFGGASLWATWGSVPVKTFLTELTGDGKADLLAWHGGQWWAATSTAAGTAFNAPTLWASWSGSTAWDVHVLDANGDGKADVVGRTANQWWLGRNTGSAFTTSLWGSWGSTALENSRVGDFDGNGKDDVAARIGGTWWVAHSPTAGWDGLASNAAAPSLQAPYAFAGWGGTGWWYEDTTVADFNGDGKADLAGRSGGVWWVTVSNSTPGVGAAGSTSNWTLATGSVWANAAYQHVGAINVRIPTSGSGGQLAASSASSPTTARSRPLALHASPASAASSATKRDDLLTLFWSRSDDDETFSSRLLAAGV